MTTPKPSPFSPAEEDAIASEVAEDLAAGQGEKHFQELFDSVTATTSTDMDPATRERLARFRIEFCAGLNDRLRGNEHGFVCLAVNDDGHGTGFVCKCRDKDGRAFTAEVSYDDGFEAAAEYGMESMGKAMMGTVIERLVEARKKYFARMEKFH